MLNKILAVAFFYFSWAANAAIISYNGYTLNEDNNIVVGGSLEWLQWDVTLGESIDSALAANGVFGGVDYGPGWTLATNVQMAELFSAFGFNNGDDENVLFDTSASYTEGTDDTLFDTFIEIFGITSYVEGGSAYGTGFDASSNSLAWFGADSDNDSRYNRAVINSDYIDMFYNEKIDYNAALTRDFFSPQTRNSATGVALVRSSTSSVEVPEPTTISFLGLGLIWLALRRKVHS